MPFGVDWNDHLIARFTALHKDGKRSFQMIADILNHEFGLRLTKNACIGKARRLGLKERPRVAPPPPPPPKRKKRTQSTPQLSVYSAWRVEPPTLPEADGRITIYQLDLGRCHYPFGDRPPYAYCGAATRRGSWCPHHERVVYPRGPR
jgi:hypothetical protein